MTIAIRPETVTDYAAIADLHARAFGCRSSEALIVAMHRHRRAFDADLSLVAVRDEHVVGHVLFSTHQLRLCDQDVAAVNLAPIAIDPACQRQGIGGQLIAEGHRVAAVKGHQLSFVLGHTAYYPRFGYRTHAYGAAQTRIVVTAHHAAALQGHSPVDADLPALRALWRLDEAAVDFALDPGPDLLDWLSPNPAVQATVYTLDGQVVGYSRIHAAEPDKPRVFLARTGAHARSMASLIAYNAQASQLSLPIHPAAVAATGFGLLACESWAAGMACELAPSPLPEYLAHVEAGQRKPGRVTWPPAFDLE